MTNNSRKDWTTGEHLFSPAGEEDSRSPCPALNALANHNVLPHNGRDMTFSQVMNGIKRVYNLSFPLAFLLTLGGFLLCGRKFKTRLDLHDLAPHDKIEHDSSLVHDDAKGNKYAPVVVDQALLSKFVAVGNSTAAYMTMQDAASYRQARNAATAKQPSNFHQAIMKGESAFIFETLGNKERKVDRDRLRLWFGEERLPDGWTGNVNETTTTLRKLNSLGNQINKIVTEISKDKSS